MKAAETGVKAAWKSNDRIPFFQYPATVTSQQLHMGEITLELSPWSEFYKGWVEEGALLAVQALAPLTALSTKARQHMHLLAYGPGAMLAGIAGRELGLGHIALVLHPDEEQILRNHFGDDEGVSFVDRVDALPEERAFHRVLLGCHGNAPQVDEAKPLVNRLLREGQFVLFGLPKESLPETFQEFSGHGFSLRGSGFQDNLAYLAGSLEVGK